MTRKIVTRALLIAGLVAASATASFAQGVASKVRRVDMAKEHLQPVAMSTVIAENNADVIRLSADQRVQIAALNDEVAALHQERTRLWAEYRAVTSRPDYNDALAVKEATPRMQRIVEINAQLEPMVARQDAQLSTILNSSQRAQAAKLVSSVKAQF